MHFFFFSFMAGNTTGHNVPFLEFASLKKRKRKAMKKVNQIYKISKKGKKKKKKRICHLVPNMVIDLLFEGKKVEGSRKYRRKERVPKVGSRREETITEPTYLLSFLVN